MNENQNTEQESKKIEWKPLDDAVRKMIVMSLFEKDLENFEILKEKTQ